MGVNGTVEGLIIQSDKPLCYEEGGEFPPYEGIDADTLGGHPAEDFVLDSELTEALAGKANSVHTHNMTDVTGLETTLAGKADATHNHPASQITAGTLGGQVNANTAAVANIGTAQIRDIYAGTTDIGVGAALATGVIYLVYE